MSEGKKRRQIVQACVCGLHYFILSHLFEFLLLLPDPRMDIISCRVTSAPDRSTVSASFLGMDLGLLFFGILLNPYWF